LPQGRGSKLGAYCGTEGLYLGPFALIECCNGTFKLRSQAKIEAVLAVAYGPDLEHAGLVAGLRKIAAQLQRGELAQAMISALLLKLGGLPEETAARLDEVLLRANFNPNQPRDWHGRWTPERRRSLIVRRAPAIARPGARAGDLAIWGQAAVILRRAAKDASAIQRRASAPEWQGRIKGYSELGPWQSPLCRRERPRFRQALDVRQIWAWQLE